MDNVQDNRYYVDKILVDLQFVIAHTQGKSQKDIEADDLLVDSDTDCGKQHEAERGVSEEK